MPLTHSRNVVASSVVRGKQANSNDRSASHQITIRSNILIYGRGHGNVQNVKGAAPHSHGAHGHNCNIDILLSLFVGDEVPVTT